MRTSADSSHATSAGDIRAIILDYGGTIDSRGVHWSRIISDAYSHAGLRVDSDSFREAYVHAERALARNPVITPTDTFLDLMVKKIEIELRYLADSGAITPADASGDVPAIATYCHERARECVMEARPVIAALHSRYPVALVSNFYGNLHAVIDDFGLTDCFDAVIESAVAGVRKPDPAIFTLGVNALAGFAARRTHGADGRTLTPAETLVVGDSYTKDILPARAIGCRTAWLKGPAWDEDDASPADDPDIIPSLSALLSLI